MSTPVPNIVRASYVELAVTELPRARWFWVDVLGFVVTAEDDEALYLRGYEEAVHHSVVLRLGNEPAAVCLAYRVWEPDDLDRAEQWYREHDCEVERRPAGATLGIGPALRVVDPLGFTLEFFAENTRTERLNQRYELHRGANIARIDHFNICVDDPIRAFEYFQSLGFRCSETIEDEDEGRLFAGWMHRKPSVHDVAFTLGTSPRLHHTGFFVPEQHKISALCDVLGATEYQHHIERGPGRHGVSNAFYVYLRDPDGHRLEIYTSDYYTGDPDEEPLRWSVHDMRRRDFWGASVVPTWYSEATDVLDLDGKVVPQRTVDAATSEAGVGADGLR